MKGVVLFKVEIKNEILGNSEHVMNYDEIAGFNLVAKDLARKSIIDGKKHTSGMWTVQIL
jgi:hypothetical protein